MAVSRKTPPLGRVPKSALYEAIFAALADGATAGRDELRDAVPQIHESTAYRLLREMVNAGVIHARRTAPGATHALRYALTVEALLSASTTQRVSSARVTLHDGARYRVLAAPCARHSQGRVLSGMVWREAVGAFQAPTGPIDGLPLRAVEAVYDARSAGFVPRERCDRAPCKAPEAYVPPSTIGVAVMALVSEHGPLTLLEIRERLPQFGSIALRTTIGHMSRAQTLSRQGEVWERGRWLIKWGVGHVPYVDRPSRGRPADRDAWAPVPWVNPIRARALGLPVAQAPREVPATDFGNPRRRAA